MCYHAKCRQNRPYRCGDITVLYLKADDRLPFRIIKIWSHKKLKKTSRWSDILSVRWNAPNGAVLNCGTRVDIADVINHTKFCVQFRCLGVLTPQDLLFSIGLAGCSYNSVGTIVLHWIVLFVRCLVQNRLDERNYHATNR